MVFNISNYIPYDDIQIQWIKNNIGWTLYEIIKLILITKLYEQIDTENNDHMQTHSDHEGAFYE